MHSRIYSIILPPEHLRGLGKPREWTPENAQAHFDWFMGIRRQRIDGLLAFFGASSPSRGNEHDFLLGLGSAVADAMSTEPNFRETEGKKELTAPGLAMAYDIGVIVAELIVGSSDGVITWTLLKKPPRALDLNLPVLAGRPTMIFEPIRGSLTEAKAILRGAESSDIWARIYSFWLGRLTNEVVLPYRKKGLVMPDDDVEG
jgi:hypothetical protein